MPALRSLFVDRRRQALVFAAVVVGAGTGLLVAAFDKLTAGVMLERLFEAPLAIQAAAPLAGLAVAALSLRWIAGGANPATADAYVENFHDRTHPMPQRPVLGRIVASIATLGSGGAMGFEGPSIYMGAAFGSVVQNRFRRFLRADETKSLLVAGAAGGVAAIFKAPATGVLFALESPYQDDIARHGLIPALVRGGHQLPHLRCPARHQAAVEPDDRRRRFQRSGPLRRCRGGTGGRLRGPGLRLVDAAGQAHCRGDAHGRSGRAVRCRVSRVGCAVAPPVRRRAHHRARVPHRCLDR